MTQIQVREAIEEDFHRIDELQNEAFPDDVLLMSSEEMLDRCQGIKSGALLVAIYENKVVGYCVLTDRSYRPWTGWDFLAVDPSYTRLGIASKLTDQAFRSANRLFIRGFVRSKNSGALAHYRKWGFVQTGLKREFYSDGDDAIVLLGQRILKPSIVTPLTNRLPGWSFN